MLAEAQLHETQKAGGDFTGPQIVPLIRQLLMQGAWKLGHRLAQARSIFQLYGV